MGVLNRQGAVPGGVLPSKEEVRGTLLKKWRMLLLLDEFCRFIATVTLRRATRDALLIEWGWNVALLGESQTPKRNGALSRDQILR